MTYGGGVPSNHIKGLERSTLRERALHALRAGLISGEFEPDEHLSEVELAESFGISRGTVREALRHLQQEGLVTSDYRGRLRVRGVTSGEIHEVFRVRAALESLAVRTIIELPDEDSHKLALERLEAAIDRLRASQGDPAEQLEADLAFHHTLCEVSGNQTLLRTWSSLEGLIRATIVRVGRAQALANMDADRHATIVEAIRNLGVTEAGRLVSEHMEAAAQSLAAALDSRN
jgi:DNA-binding GntR family transcriptional regulator